MRLLLIEDSLRLQESLRAGLTREGFAVDVVGDGSRGLAFAKREHYDVILLDLMLPGLDGFEVLRELRSRGSEVHVLILTARHAVADRVRGLRRGADDYVVKPFSTTELLARVEAVLRRSAERPEGVAAITVAGRAIDFERREVRLADGGLVQLTERESGLLQYLAANPGRAIDRSELLRCVWGLDPRGVQTRTVDMHVARLREHLQDDPGDARVLITVRGKGYMLGAVEEGG